MVTIRSMKRSRTSTYLVFQWNEGSNLFDGHLCDADVTGEDGPREIAHDVFERFPDVPVIALVSADGLSCLIQGRDGSPRGPAIEVHVWHRNDRWGSYLRTTVEEQTELWKAQREENTRLLAKWKAERKARKSA